MRYYIEINGISSLTLTGFAIKELPPISKPPIRNQIEQIDGRDGDLITKLGYGAYDKTIEVGLYGEAYDINEIISFFNSEGTISFSNEPDKYYNFTMLNQIDFEKLQKFKTASITFHCQPFKYKKDEEPIEVEYEYVEGEGTNITLNNTDEASLELDLFGNTSQETTTGKNLFDSMKTGTTKNGVTFTPNSDGSITVTGTATSGINIVIVNTNNPPILEAGTYTRSVKAVGTITKNNNYVFLTGRNSTNDNIMGDLTINGNNTMAKTSTLTGTNTMNGIGFYLSGSGAVFDCTLYIQLEKNSTATDWEPFTNGPSPNPDYPQDVHIVSGDNEIVVCGKNLFDKDTVVNGYLNADGTLYDTLNYNTSDYIIVEPNTSYYKTATSSPRTKYYDKNKQPLNTTTYQDISIGGNEGTFTTPNNAYYLRFSYPIATVDANSIMLHKGTTASTYEPYNGDTYNIDLPVENLFNKNDNNSSNAGTTLTVLDTGVRCTITTAGNNKYSAIKMSNSDELLGKTLTISASINCSASNDGLIRFYWLNNNSLTDQIARTLTSTGSATFIVPSSYPSGSNGIAIVFSSNASGASNVGDYVDYTNIMLEVGSKANSYTPFGTTPIEMCKIPNTDYIDGFEYNINEDKWYLHKEIGKVVLNGSETIQSYTTSVSGHFRYFFDAIGIKKPSGTGEIPLVLSNRYVAQILGMAGSWGAHQGISVDTGGDKIVINDDTYYTQDSSAYKTWLQSNNVIAFYALETPTTEPVTYQPLIDQLNVLLEAMAKKGQTNISQINNDLPFYIKAITRELGSDTAVINNEGNIESKPILNIEGEGTIGVSLNGNQIFNVDLSDPNQITIDPNKLEAYNPSSLNLMNRKVIGDIANLKMPEGTNNLKFSGGLTKATIKNYSRWL